MGFREAGGMLMRGMSHYKFVVAGGGAGGCAAAANLVKHGSVAVIDPAQVTAFNVELSFTVSLEQAFNLLYNSICYFLFVQSWGGTPFTTS